MSNHSTTGLCRSGCVVILALSLHALLAAPAEKSGISSQRLLEHTKVLSSDEFEGRAPATPGEEKTVDYVIRQFKRLGLEAGNPDGSYIQNVPLVGITANPSACFQTNGTKTPLVIPDDCVLWSRRVLTNVQVTDSPVLFVGYGVVAPEYAWDDFKGVDVRGKTILMLVGDPPIPDPNDPAKLDPHMFKGREMTYYGRWTYKFEIAARLGAAAALVIHDTEAAGYPFSVVIDSNTGERFELDDATSNPPPAAVEGWLTTGQAKALFAATGLEFDVLKKAAARPDFKPVLLESRASFTVTNTIRHVTSHNVAGALRGSDPKLKDEFVLYSAHWDHLGRVPKLSGDAIYHGAVDNASGVAGLLEIAREFVARKPQPKRSLVFLALTSEEQGLLGAKYYAENPLYPLNRTLADLNMDAPKPWGRTRDVAVYGFGSTTLEELLGTAAQAQGRVLVPDPEPEKGSFFRADHFEFARAGLPVLYFDSGLDYVGKPPGYGKQKRMEFTLNDYHKPTDVIKPDWDLSGLIENLNLYLAVGRAVADGDQWPQWKDGSDFQGRRAAMLKAQP